MGVPAGQMYEEGSLEEFVERTGPSMEASPEYLIGIGDRLDVVFLYHTNLSQREVLVRDDGRISLPYVGDQMAMGYTPAELDSILTGRYSEILKQPNIAVMLNLPAEKQVYVVGYVQRPGGYEIKRPISMMQALALAGGIKSGGKPQNTVLIRRDRDEVLGIEIDVKAIMKGESVGSDVLLKNFDIVYVPKSRLKSVEEFSESVSKIIALPLGTTLQGWQIVNSIEQYQYFRLRNDEDVVK